MSTRVIRPSRPAVRWPPNHVRQQLADLEARGALPLAWRFAKRGKAQNACKCGRVKTLGDLAPDFSRLRQLLALLAWYEQPHRKSLRRQSARCQTPQARLWISAFRHGREMCACQRATGISSHTMLNRGQFASWPCVERLRCIRRWFESD